MSIQGYFDNEALSMLPKILVKINNAEKFESNEMVCRTLREINNSEIALINMNIEQINEFQDDLINIFKFYNWI